MKKILSILLCVVFGFGFVACSSQPSIKIKQEFDAQGRTIKEITLVQGEIHSTTTFQYGADGNCSRKEYYDKDNVLTYYITYEYNSKAQVIKKTQYQENKMFSETTMEYNDKDLLSRSDTITYQGGKAYNLYFYDENNNLFESKQYAVYSNGDSLSFWNKFDKAGNKVSSSHYITSGALDYTKEWEYDSENRVERMTEYDSENCVKRITVYDNNGNIKSVTEYDKNGNSK